MLDGFVKCVLNAVNGNRPVPVIREVGDNCKGVASSNLHDAFCSLLIFSMLSLGKHPFWVPKEWYQPPYVPFYCQLHVISTTSCGVWCD